jgi:hypothetical protein
MRSTFLLPFLTALLIGGAAYSAVAYSAVDNPSDTSGWTLAQKENFLLTASIGDGVYAGKGITHSQKVTLTEGATTHAAHVQTIDVYMPLFKGKDGSREQDFRDSWKFNVAAYRLAKLINLTDMVPVCVSRVVDGKPAGVDWWVDNVLMDEKERVTKNIQPPDAARWRGQMDTIRVFDQLIYNMDRRDYSLPARFAARAEEFAASGRGAAVEPIYHGRRDQRTHGAARSHCRQAGRPRRRNHHVERNHYRGENFKEIGRPLGGTPGPRQDPGQPFL